MANGCPNCGNNLQYDAAFLLWRCRNCRRIYTRQELNSERIHQKAHKRKSRRSGSHEEVWYAPRDSRMSSTLTKTESQNARKPGKSGANSPVKSLFSGIAILALLFALVLVAASTVSLSWPQGIVRFVPKQLEVLRVLPTSMDLTSGETTVFEMVNEIRTKEGLSPLKWDESIAAYSRKHSSSMAEKRDLYHNKVELAALMLGENVALTPRFAGGFILLPYPVGLALYKTDQELLSETVASWMQSPGHRQNILNPNYKFTGVGIAVAEDGVTHYLTQNFR